MRIDLQKWEDARNDFRKALECGAVSSDVDKELHRLRRFERQQDAKDGKTLKHTFDEDRPSIYDTATSKGVEKALRDIKEDALRRKARGPSTRKPVTKTSSQNHYDWTTSYTKEIPRLHRRRHRHEPVVVEDLAAEIEAIRRGGGKRRSEARTTTTRRSPREHAGPAARAWGGGGGLTCDFAIICVSTDHGSRSISLCPPCAGARRRTRRAIVRVLERRYGLVEIVERGAVVLVDRPRANSPHRQRGVVFSELASRNGHHFPPVPWLLRSALT